MTKDLRAQLAGRLQGRICLLGIGNVDLGDDAFGVRLAESLAGQVSAEVCVAGTVPEEYMGKLMGQYDSVLFLDVVQFGAEPGTVILLDSEELAVRFPQVSTHKLALGMLAKLLEDEGAQVSLLGLQPGTLASGSGLSEVVEASRQLLAELLQEILTNKPA